MFRIPTQLPRRLLLLATALLALSCIPRVDLYRVPGHKERGRESACAGVSGPVLVVGAGVSGLVAAQSLRHFGCRVLVFEALDRLGGRTHTLPAGPFAGLEEGAQWVHGGVDNLPSSRLLSFAGVGQVRVGGDEVWEGRRDALKLFLENSQHPLSDGQRDASFGRYVAAREAVSSYVESACGEEEPCDFSVAEAWREALRGSNFTREEKLALRFHQRLQYEHDTGSSMADISARTWFQDDYTDFNPDDEAAGWQKHGDGIVEGGYSAVIRRLADGLDVRLGTPVEAVEHSSSGAAVRLRGGRRVEGAAVLVTASVGVLRAGAIRFEPALPGEKEAVLRRLGMGSVAKVFVKLRPGADESRLGSYATGRMTAGDEIATMCFRAGFEGRGEGALVCFAGGDAAREVEGLSEERLQQRVEEELSAIIGPGWVEDVAVSSWGANPFIKGAWSNIPPGATSADMDTLAAPTGTNLYFAGEGTCRLLYGTVHGAVVSGARAAREILGPEPAGAHEWPFFAGGMFQLCTEDPETLADE